MSQKEALERDVEQALRAELRGLAESFGEPRPEVEVRLRQRYREAAARNRQGARRTWVWALAATLILGIGVGAWLTRRDPPPAPAAAMLVEEPAPFVLLDHGRPTHEITAGRLVRVTLPPSAPAWFGLPVDPRAEEGIEAEVLLSDDGVAQAVRLVGNR